MVQAADLIRAHDHAGDWRAVEAVAREWLLRKRFYLPHLYLIRALLKMDRETEADAEFEKLVAYKFNLADRLSAFPDLQSRYAARLGRHFLLDTMRAESSLETRGGIAGIRRWEMKPFGADKRVFLDEGENLFQAAFAGGKRASREGAQICCLGGATARALAAALARQGLGASYVTWALGDEAPEHWEVGTEERVSDFLLVVEEGSNPGAASGFRRCAGSLRSALAQIADAAPRARRLVALCPAPTAMTGAALMADVGVLSVWRAAIHEVIGGAQDPLYMPIYELCRWLGSYSSVPMLQETEKRPALPLWLLDFVAEQISQGLLADPGEIG